MIGNNPKLDLVNFDAHKKIGQILSICSQSIEQKQNSDINQGPKLCQKLANKSCHRMTCALPLNQSKSMTNDL